MKNLFRSDLYFAKHHKSKIDFLKEKRMELLRIVSAGPYSKEMDYIYEAILNLTLEIERLENEKYI